MGTLLSNGLFYVFSKNWENKTHDLWIGSPCYQKTYAAIFLTYNCYNY